jgi:hypothetical protein
VDTDIDRELNTLTVQMELESIKDILTVLKDDGFLPDEIVIEHMEKEINFRIEEMNPLVRGAVKTENKTPSFVNKWTAESKGDTWNV